MAEEDRADLLAGIWVPDANVAGIAARSQFAGKGKGHAANSAGVAGESSFRFAFVQVPEDDGLVAAAGGQSFACFFKGQAGDAGLVAQEGVRLLGLLIVFVLVPDDVPDLDGALVGPDAGGKFRIV